MGYTSGGKPSWGGSWPERKGGRKEIELEMRICLYRLEDRRGAERAEGPLEIGPPENTENETINQDKRPDICDNASERRRDRSSQEKQQQLSTGILRVMKPIRAVCREPCLFCKENSHGSRKRKAKGEKPKKSTEPSGSLRLDALGGQ